MEIYFKNSIALFDLFLDFFQLFEIIYLFSFLK
jgi:hypothetical protein